MESIQNSNLQRIVDEKLKAIRANLDAYKNVDATLSTDTLFGVATCLEIANNKLERGMIRDACNEIEEKHKYN